MAKTAWVCDGDSSYQNNFCYIFRFINVFIKWTSYIKKPCPIFVDFYNYNILSTITVYKVYCNPPKQAHPRAFIEDERKSSSLKWHVGRNKNNF